MQYVDKDGSSHNPIMGCYGIGVGRLAASICEAKHDDFGPIWPISIAPWEPIKGVKPNVNPCPVTKKRNDIDTPNDTAANGNGSSPPY